MEMDLEMPEMMIVSTIRLAWIISQGRKREVGVGRSGVPEGGFTLFSSHRFSSQPGYNRLPFFFILAQTGRQMRVHVCMFVHMGHIFHDPISQRVRTYVDRHTYEW